MFEYIFFLPLERQESQECPAIHYLPNWKNIGKYNTCAEISRKSISWFNIFIMNRVNYERLLPLLFQNIGQ